MRTLADHYLSYLAPILSGNSPSRQAYIRCAERPFIRNPKAANPYSPTSCATYAVDVSYTPLWRGSNVTSSDRRCPSSEQNDSPETIRRPLYRKSNRRTYEVHFASRDPYRLLEHAGSSPLVVRVCS